MSASFVNQPLVSFVVCAYNQEQFITDAVKGAFSQTYSPCEIILSDDCSTDSTFDLIQSLANSYAGPHSLVLNRNERNLGLVGHVNRIASLARGEWIVGSAGDDVSVSNRIELTLQALLEQGSKAKSVFLGVEPINELPGVEWKWRPRLDTLSLRSQATYGGAALPGASQAYHRSVFEVFGDIPHGLGQEDRVIPFRAALLGGCIYKETVGVRYRIHARALSSHADSQGNAFGQDRVKSHLAKQRVLWLAAMERDLDLAATRGLVDRGVIDETRALLRRAIERAGDESKVRDGSTLARLRAAVRMLMYEKEFRPSRSRWLIIFARALHPHLGCALSEVLKRVLAKTAPKKV